VVGVKQPSATILVTIKNSARTIKKCVDSLLKQNYRNYKIYFVDSFSTDGTYEILKEYGKKIKVEQFKSNPPQAYNHAIKKINTEFLAFTDGDCVADRNWLKNLIAGFKSEDIVAVAGYCKTPQNVTFLQRLIGIELENRFKQFPEYIPRAPTMNICIRTKILKKLKFNNKLFVGYDTDFGYRLMKIGKKILYEPKAVIYHYHRATWRNLFKQQFTYAKYLPLIYSGHKTKIKGDYISKPSMALHLAIFYLGFLFLLLSLFSNTFLMIFGLFVTLFLLISLYEFAGFKTRKEYFLYFLLIFFVRTLAWSIGLIFGIFKRS
jgi:cellulose synthase/poly-beta-1,6-N-acetylglucosamine synthase-like glycosyltransferase